MLNLSRITILYSFNGNNKKLNICRALLQGGSWPSDMKYITCEQYDGTNTPERAIDLRSSFSSVRLLSNLYHLSLN